MRGNGGTSTDWQVSDDKPPVTSDNWGQGDQGPSDLVKVVLLGAPGVGKTAIAQVCMFQFDEEKKPNNVYFINKSLSKLSKVFYDF